MDTGWLPWQPQTKLDLENTCHCLVSQSTFHSQFALFWHSVYHCTLHRLLPLQQVLELVCKPNVIGSTGVRLTCSVFSIFGQGFRSNVQLCIYLLSPKQYCENNILAKSKLLFCSGVCVMFLRLHFMIETQMLITTEHSNLFMSMV